MRKKGFILFLLAAMFAFASCGKEAAETSGQGVETPAEGQGTGTPIPGQEEEISGSEGNVPGQTETIATPEPKPTATPVPTMTPERIALVTELREVYKDEVSAKIVEKGYFYEINQVAEDENYRIEFKAVTGDMEKPKLVMDVTVKDEVLAATYDEIKIFVHTLGEDAFSNVENQWPNDGHGIKDATQPNLFHVIANGNPYWMADGDAVVVDVCGINFEDTEYYDFEIEREINTKEFRIQVPKYEFHPIPKKEYTGLTYNHRGTEFFLEQAVCGQYVTELFIASYVDAETIKEYPGGITQYEAMKQPEWTEFYSGLTLEVDGTEYTVKQDGYYMSFFETDSTEGAFKGTGYAELSGFDYVEASEVILWAGTTGYDLKSGSSTPLTRELPPSSESTELSSEQKELAELVRTYYKDEVSASLIEQGYYRMVDESFSDDIFRFDFKAVMGDEDNSVMVFDVYVDDAVLAATFDKICLRVGAYREEYYDAEDWIWNCEGYGYRNEEAGNLYHVVLNGCVFGYAPAMVDIYQIGFDQDTNPDNGIQWYKVNPVAKLVDVPMEVFCSVPEIKYDESSMLFTYEGKQYDLWRVNFGNYDTELEFHTYFDAKEVPTEESALWEYRESIQENWLGFSSTLRLVVDGVEYAVFDEEEKRGYVWFDVREGEDFYRGNAVPYFPAVDFWEASEILIKSGETVYKLK